MTGLRIDHVETSGKFRLDGGEWDVDNNIWIVGDDSEVCLKTTGCDGLSI